MIWVLFSCASEMESCNNNTEQTMYLDVLDPKNLLSNSCGVDVSVSSTAEEQQSTTSHKILHFSDGTLEYDSDEDEVDEVKPADNLVDPKTLTWGPWMLHYLSTAGVKTLGVCDYLGEGLANFFGITTPKYQYEIEEYYRMQAEEEETKQREDLEMGGWVEKQTEGSEMIVHTSENERTRPTIPPPQTVEDNSVTHDKQRNSLKETIYTDEDCSSEEIKHLI